MKVTAITIKGAKIIYDKDNVKIVDSYKVKGEDMADVLFWFIFKTGYKSRRDMDSWIREWKTHNRLYRLGIYRDHTKDCDLNEDEKWWRLWFYEILGI